MFNALKEYKSKIDNLTIELEALLSSGEFDIKEVQARYSKFIKEMLIPVINAIDENIAYGRFPQGKKGLLEDYVKRRMQIFQLTDFRMKKGEVGAMKYGYLKKGRVIKDMEARIILAK